MRASIKLFNGKDNFTLWQRKMRNVLIRHKVDVALEESKPTSMSDADWAEKCKIAKSCIELHLADNVVLQIGEELTAKQAWDKLQSVYMGTTISNKLLLKEQLFGLKMEKGMILLIIYPSFRTA